MAKEELVTCREELIEQVVGSAIAVHKVLGPGLLESAYELALAFELTDRDIMALRQVEVLLCYKGKTLGSGFRADIVIEGSLLVEIKSVAALETIHISQVITYLKLLKIKRGLLINFNTRLLKNGIKRISI